MPLQTKTCTICAPDRRLSVTKDDQKKLLLLRHAQKCNHGKNCPVTQHCADMKNLWSHIYTCKISDCQYCNPTRIILLHYSKCKDTRCPFCEPVRRTIRTNYVINRVRQINNK